MRQILVKENALLRTLSGDKIEFTVKEFRADHVVINEKVQLLRCPFRIDIVSGGDLKLKFELPKWLAQQGAILHGAYWEADEVTVAVSSITGNIPLDKDAVLVVGCIYETARYRQIILEPVLPVKGKKKKRK